jgi:hypothetical protein
MRTVAKSRPPYVHKLHVRVVHQSGCIEGAVHRLAAEAVMREATKLGVHQRDEPIERLFVSLTPLTQQQSDV